MTIKKYSNQTNKEYLHLSKYCLTITDVNIKNPKKDKRMYVFENNLKRLTKLANNLSSKYYVDIYPTIFKDTDDMTVPLFCNY